MLESADRADLQPVTELYGGKRHCRKVSTVIPIKTKKNMQKTAQLTLTFSWVGQCPMTLVTPRTSLGCG